MPDHEMAHEPRSTELPANHRIMQRTGVFSAVMRRLFIGVYLVVATGLLILVLSPALLGKDVNITLSRDHGMPRVSVSFFEFYRAGSFSTNYYPIAQLYFQPNVIWAAYFRIEDGHQRSRIYRGSPGFRTYPDVVGSEDSGVSMRATRIGIPAWCAVSVLVPLVLLGLVPIPCRFWVRRQRERRGLCRKCDLSHSK